MAKSKKKTFEMNFKHKCLLFFLTLITLSFVFAFQLTTFTNSLTAENLTFTGDQNISRTLSIPKNANVTSAFMNLSGFKDIEDMEIYQENANFTISAVIGEIGYVYFNYTKLDSSINSSKWHIKISGTIQNITLDNECWETYPDKVVLRFSSHKIGNTGNTFAHCMKPGGWFQVSTSSASFIGISQSFGSFAISRIFDGSWDTDGGYAHPQLSWFSNVDSADNGVLWEEAIIWNISSSIPTNPYVLVNNSQIWNFTGMFSQTNNKTDDFSDTLNTALNFGTCDCEGCSIVGDNCTIPFTFHSDTAGKLEYSDINIQFQIQNVTLVSPANDSDVTSGQVFTCNVSNALDLKNMTLFIWNSTGQIFNQTTNDISGTENETSFQIDFDYNDIMEWNCLSNDGGINFAEFNRTIDVFIEYERNASELFGIGDSQDRDASMFRKTNQPLLFGDYEFTTDGLVRGLLILMKQTKQLLKMFLEIILELLLGLNK